MVPSPNHRAACSMHFPSAAISLPLRTAISQSGSGWETCVIHLSAFSLSGSRRRFLLRGRVRLPAPPPLAAEAIHPSLGHLPASRPHRGSFWGSCALPSDAEITAGLEKSRQGKHLGGPGAFWELLCSAEEAAVGCGQAEQRRAPRAGTSANCFGVAVGASSLHPALAAACPDGQGGSELPCDKCPFPAAVLAAAGQGCRGGEHRSPHACGQRLLAGRHRSHISLRTNPSRPLGLGCLLPRGSARREPCTAPGIFAPT